MKIREIPLVRGLSKSKLTVLFTILILGIFGIVVYVINRGTQASPKAEISQQQNYSPGNSGTDVSQILKYGHKVASKAVTVVKETASSVVTTTTTSNQQKNQEEQDYKNAMKAPISANELKPQNEGNVSKNSNASQAASEDSGLPKDDSNQTAEKRAFIKANSTVVSSVKDRIADYVLSMGTKIPAQVDQDIDSDLPGQIYGHISRDVFDSRTHDVLLLPAGSNLVGTYDSSVSYGQERLLVAWQRINLPNGQFIDLPGFGGADAMGAGFGDEVDNHYDKIWGATILTSILAAGAQLSQPQQSNALQAPSVGQTLGSAVGSQVANTGTALLSKNLNLQPTLHIRPGFEFTVEVNKDMVFPGAYTANANK